MVELDVQLTADGLPVVLHDDTLERCSNVTAAFPGRTDYRVQSFQLNDIQSLDAGSWFVRELERPANERQPFLQSLRADERQQYISDADRSLYASGRVRHPTLRESLVECRKSALEINIELKAPKPADSNNMRVPIPLVDQVVRLVAETGCKESVLISSFDHECLRIVKKLDPSLPVGVLTTIAIPDAVAYCRQLQASAYHPGCLPDADAVGFESDAYRQSGLLLAEPFQSLRQAGIAVNVWTENDPVRMKQLVQAGASGIFTDYPNRLTREPLDSPSPRLRDGLR
jgi:glycerophosphoryl diester phosphodiesterase